MRPNSWHISPPCDGSNRGKFSELADKLTLRSLALPIFRTNRKKQSFRQALHCNRRSKTETEEKMERTVDTFFLEFVVSSNLRFTLYTTCGWEQNLNVGGFLAEFGACIESIVVCPLNM